MNILLIDNYDSFTYNLFHILEQYDGSSTVVKRVDEIEAEELSNFDAVVISPGPGLPSESPALMELTRTAVRTKKVIGVCLGHQAIAEAFGGRLVNLDKVFHGLSLRTKILIAQDPLFKNLPSEIMTGRYHSWVINKDTLPPELEVTAIDENQNIMAIRHIQFPVWGIQFHPESVLTEYGKAMLFNWLDA